MRIATFNLLHGQPLRDGRPLPFPDGAADGPLAEAVAALDADVLALQEVDRYQERSGGTDQAAVAALALGAADWRFAAALHGRPAPVSGWIPLHPHDAGTAGESGPRVPDGPEQDGPEQDGPDGAAPDGAGPYGAGREAGGPGAGEPSADAAADRAGGDRSLPGPPVPGRTAPGRTGMGGTGRNRAGAGRDGLIRAGRSRNGLHRNGSAGSGPTWPPLKIYGPHDSAPPGGGTIVPAYGTALLSRLPVRLWRARWFPPAPIGLPLRVAGRNGLTRVPDEPRTVLAAVLEGRRGPFTVVAAHLSFVPGWNMGQLAAIRRWIADLPAPYLLLGDLNLVGAVPRTVLGGAAVVESVTRRGAVRPPRPARRREISSRVVLGGWQDLARLPTYPSHRPAVQFDHVLAVGVPRAAVRGASTPRSPISDHRPLVVDLAL